MVENACHEDNANMHVIASRRVQSPPDVRRRDGRVTSRVVITSYVEGRCGDSLRYPALHAACIHLEGDGSQCTSSQRC
jgi:hypothetical protein